MGSTDWVNYSIRPNKNVERKLIVECLKSLENDFKISQYIYVGMGSFWFVDFKLMHKDLSINSMFSIEYEEYEKRAEFNKPYKCVDVIPGKTTDALEIFDLRDKRAIIWLDYDKGFYAPFMRDMQIVCSVAKSGTIFILTLNASYRQLKNVKNNAGEPLSPEAALKKFVGSLAPISLARYRTDKSFSILLSQILFDNAKGNMTDAGRKETFLPLFNFSYKDGAPMITVAGMIANEEDRQLLEKCNLQKRFGHITGDKQYPIHVPPLTRKEKTELDRLLPSSNLTVKEIEEKIGLSLKQEQIDAYRNFYTYYPVFAEVHI